MLLLCMSCSSAHLCHDRSPSAVGESRRPQHSRPSRHSLIIKIIIKIINIIIIIIIIIIWDLACKSATCPAV
eukprot:1409505-Karenia_brevis.AAC.1